MNITHKELCDFYRAYLQGKIPPSRKDCLSAAELAASFDPRTRKAAKTKNVDHISQCALCAREFEGILEIQRGTRSFAEELSARLESERDGRNSPKNAIRDFFVPRPWRRHVAFLGGILLFLAGITWLIHKAPVGTIHLQGQRENGLPEIRLIEPLQGSVSKAHLIFKWSPNPLADFYILDLYDESLRRVWRSPHLSENRCFLPRPWTDARPGPKTYLWMVTGYKKGGGIIESPLTGFTLLD